MKGKKFLHLSMIKTRITAILCAICMVSAVMPAKTAFAETAGTFFDDNNTEFTYSYDMDSKVLTIDGNGAMSWALNNHVTSLPWYEYRSEILGIEIKSGITQIGRQLFSGLSSVSSVTIPGTVNTLQWGAFENCTSLTEATLESGVTTLSDKIFIGCSSLSKVTLPETVTSLGNAVFSGTAIKTLDIPTSVKNIRPLHSNDTADTFANLPEDFEATIHCGSGAHSWVVNPAINISFKYTIVGEASDMITGTFANKSGEQNALSYEFNPDTAFLTISGTGDMPDFADDGNDIPWGGLSSQIRYINVGSGITSIGKRAFQLCSSAVSASIAGTVKTIYAYAFNSCSSLTHAEIPYGIEEMKGEVFNRCSSLKKLTIPPTMKSVSASNFRYTSPDLTLTVYGGTAAHTWAASESNNCMNTDGTSSAKAYEAINETGIDGGISWEYDWQSRTITFTGNGAIPDSNTRDWHRYKSVMEKAVLSNGITNVGKSCFTNCTALNEVSIPSTVTMIRDSAFYGCTSLTELKLPDSTRILGLNIINKTAIKELTVPASVTTIYPNNTDKKHIHKTFNDTAEGFTLNVCKGSYAEEWVKGTTTDATSLETINNFEGNWNVVYPNGKVTDTISWTYNTDTKTMTFSGTGEMPGWTTVDVDGDGDIKDEPTWYENRSWNAYNASMTKLVIEEGITLIGADSFRSSSSLLELDIASTVKSIGNYAFANSSLKQITFPNGLESIGTGAFQLSNSAEVLSTVMIPDSVTSISPLAFRNQSALVIYCKNNSYAQSFAEQYGISYTVMDSDYYITYSPAQKKAVITNYRSEAQNACIIFANYMNGALNDIKLYEAALAPGKTEITADTLDEANGSITKIIITDSMTALKPLCKNLEVNIKPSLRLAGDSIMCKWPADRYGQQGWGEPFRQMFGDDINVYNDAVSGYTAENFYEIKWPAIKSEMKSGDYLIVSYVHNDYYKQYGTDPQENYIETYRSYIQQFIDETKEMGVNIILVVPPNRGVNYNFHKEFSDVIPTLANENNVPCINIHKKTEDMLDADLDGTKQLIYMYKLVEQGIITQEQLDNHTNKTLKNTGEDLTHVSTNGAEWIANYVMGQIEALVPELASYKK